jgi:hypothetical protein
MTKRQTPIQDNTLGNLFAPALLDFEPAAIRMGTQWARAYAILSFPTQVGPGWLTELANLDGVTLSLHANPENPYTLMQALNRRVGQLGGQLDSAKNGPLQIGRLQRQITDAERLLAQMDAEQQAVFQILVVATVHAANAADGEALGRNLQSAAAAHGMRAVALSHRQDWGLQADGPWGWWPTGLQNDAPQTWPVMTVAAAWPFGSDTINHRSGIILGHDQQQGLVMVNRWNPPKSAGLANKNEVRVATSGGGKTFGTIVTVLREWIQGAKIFILDPEKREYQKICRYVGGNWLDAAGGSTRINPFQPVSNIVASDPDAETDSPELALRQHIQQVLTFLQTLLPGLDAIHQSLLAGAVRQAYAHRGIVETVDPLTVPADQWPTIVDVYEHCGDQQTKTTGHTQEVWADLAALLQEPAVGAFAHLWAGRSTVPVTADADFVVADLMQLHKAPATIKRAQYLNVLNYFWDLVRQSKADRKLLVADEAWMLIDPQNPETLRFLGQVARLIRGYNGGLMTITQKVYDFLAPEVRRDGEAILTNAAIRLLLRQDKKDLEYLVPLFALSDEQQSLLLSADPGDGLLLVGNSRAWIHIDPTPGETALIEGRRRD